MLILFDHRRRLAREVFEHTLARIDAEERHVLGLKPLTTSAVGETEKTK
jgi:hypothetical protein